MEHVIEKAREQVEYQNFVIVCEFLNLNAKMTGSGSWFKVGNTYLDFGADWMWTTILGYNADSVFGSWQVLNPREWKEIYMADPADLYKIADEIIHGKYFKA